VLIIGGGYIGLETAATCRHMGYARFGRRERAESQMNLAKLPDPNLPLKEAV
jgi:threonine dehydrogenase-like Zn-dependent dehydrogenase